MNILKKLTPVYLAASLLISGCTTVPKGVYSKETEIASNKRIEFKIDERAETLDQMISVSENIEEGFGYINRFNAIKAELKRNPNYDSGKDIKSLVEKVERSDLRNKFSLSNQIKDFSYYRYDTVQTKLECAVPEKVINYTSGGLFIYGAVQVYSEDGNITSAILSFIGAGLLYILGDDVLIGDMDKKKTKNQKVLINPYHGTIKVIF